MPGSKSLVGGFSSRDAYFRRWCAKLPIFSELSSWKTETKSRPELMAFTNDLESVMRLARSPVKGSVCRPWLVAHWD